MQNSNRSNMPVSHRSQTVNSLRRAFFDTAVRQTSAWAPRNSQQHTLTEVNTQDYSLPPQQKQLLRPRGEGASISSQLMVFINTNLVSKSKSSLGAGELRHGLCAF